MNVLDVSTEICDCLLGSFTLISVRMAHIPQCCDIVASKDVKEIAKLCSISINAYCFNKECNLVLLCFFKTSPEYLLCNCVSIFLCVACVYTHIGTVESGCKSDVIFNFLDVFLHLLLVCDITKSVNTRNGKLKICKISYCSVYIFFTERAVDTVVDTSCSVVNLKTLKAEILCHGVKIFP